ncbi:hypothetical protein AXG93_163s1100 [Marchantia polymorpha subsp. ruderalis]|uniref:Uncharacterized protein n=1 Tax=Marchantia polymorpha subsp. ruderalis TaxID=1480154 RepID=A0A176VC44_MARPO|nr:hypothetical protein AXG93_163s1100 [Marchantia polymorpha subsp. ruderalis]
METAESSAKVSKFLAQGSDVNGERKEASALRCSQEKWEPRLTPRASIFWVPRKCKTEDLHRQKSGDGKTIHGLSSGHKIVAWGGRTGAGPQSDESSSAKADWVAAKVLLRA